MKTRKRMAAPNAPPSSEDRPSPEETQRRERASAPTVRDLRDAAGRRFATIIAPTESFLQSAVLNQDNSRKET
ncbi:MAG: hypothetical protein SF339_26430 [Blastocatellia bacterium]|nr:hypothetical protein [Blastocatellia bacterium]